MIEILLIVYVQIYIIQIQTGRKFVNSKITQLL